MVIGGPGCGLPNGCKVASGPLWKSTPWDVHGEVSHRRYSRAEAPESGVRGGFKDCVLEKPPAHHDYGARKAYHAAGARNGGGVGATGTGPGKVNPCCSCQLWENIWRRCPCSGAGEGGTPEQGSTPVSSHSASPLSFPDDALV